MKYLYSGEESIFSDYSNYVYIKWLDGTRTQSIVRGKDKFDFEVGVLICVAKKFVDYLSIDKLDKSLNRKQFKMVLRLLIATTAGGRCLLYAEKAVKEIVR